MAIAPRTAMVLAAGLGERMRPLTDRMPKPLVPVAGRPLIDHVLDRLAAAGIERAVVNVHYLADMIERHLKGRTRPQIVISDERQALLNTGGGVVKALAAIGREPFIHVNSDTIWIDGVKPNLERLAEAFDPATMDALLLLAPVADQHRLCRPRRFHHGLRRAADAARRTRDRAVRLCRRGDPAPQAVQGRARRGFFADDAVRPRRGRGPAAWAAPRRRVDARRHAGGHQASRSRYRGERGLTRGWPYQQQRLSVATRLIPASPARAGNDTMRAPWRFEPRVFTIPASAPFLPTLIGALMEDRLGLGFKPGGDPLALAGATIYLPTRRACRLAQKIFLDVLKRDAAILPRIVPIGDVDEDELAFAEAAIGETAGATLDLPDAITGLERKVLLAQLILKWAASPELRGDGNFSLVANSPAAALSLAGELARLMDDMVTRQVPWRSARRPRAH